ncbi:MAG: hypothetical protein M0O96_10195 [Desulforhopalus sp.]|nr:hypothetical protein [Desulforhopalus sp.]
MSPLLPHPEFQWGRQHRQTQSPRLATVLRLQNLTIVTSMEKGFDLLPEKHSTIAMKVLR